LSEPNPSVRLQVVRSLGNQRSRQALSPLMNVIINDPVCRGEAEAALDKFYQGGRLSLIGKQDRAAKGALKRLSSALGHYQDQMDLAMGEGSSFDSSIWAPYQTALKSEDPSVRFQAVVELGRAGDPEAGRILMVVLREEGTLGEAAALNLGRSGIHDVLSLLPASLRDASSTVRHNTALAMGFSGRKTFSDPLLAAAVQEKNDDVREAMISAVGEIADPSAVPSLKNLDRIFPIHGNQISQILHRLASPSRDRDPLRPEGTP